MGLNSRIRFASALTGLAAPAPFSGKASRRPHVVRKRIHHTPIIKAPNGGFYNGGEDEIRTHDRFDPMPAFQASALNRSATSPLSYALRNFHTLDGLVFIRCLLSQTGGHLSARKVHNLEAAT